MRARTRLGVLVSARGECSTAWEGQVRVNRPIVSTGLRFLTPFQYMWQPASCWGVRNDSYGGEARSALVVADRLPAFVPLCTSFTFDAAHPRYCHFEPPPTLCATDTQDGVRNLKVIAYRSSFRRNYSRAGLPSGVIISP